MANVFASKQDNLRYDSWTEFKKFIDGTYALLSFFWGDKGGIYTIITEEWGGITRELSLFQDGGADQTDFETNFKNLAPRNPGSNHYASKDGYITIRGAGTPGTPVGGVLTIQGHVSGTPIPISGNITASNASVSDNDLAIPLFSNLIGGSDGTNLRSLRVFDVDSGAGTQWVLGVGLRKAAGGGSVEFGTSSDPIRIDPTGTTTQPVSGTVTANQGGSWTVAGTGNFTVVQSTASNLRAQLSSESTYGNPIPPTALLAGGSDGTNLRPFFTDSSGRQIVIGAAADGAAATGNPVLIGGSDGTNARTIRTATDGTVRVDPTGTTTQPVSGTVTANAGSGTFAVSGTVTANIGASGSLALDATLAKLTISQSTALGSNTQALVGGSVTTAAPSYTTGNINPLSLTTTGSLRVDGSGVTQPVSGTVAATQSGTWTVQPGNTANTTPWLITINQGGNSATVTASNALKVDGSSVTQPVSGTVTVVGAAADGTAVTGNPVLIGGQDGTNVQSIATDGYGRVQVSITGASITQVEGRTADGYTLVGNPLPAAGVDDDGYVQNLHVDSSGNLQVIVTASTSSIGQSIRNGGFISAGTTVYDSYTVPSGKSFKVTNYYVGGTASGNNTSLNSKLSKYDSTATAFVEEGDFETAGDVTAWAVVTGAFTAPSPDVSSVQFFTGASSMRWIYTSSATAHERKNTLTSTLDASGYRFIRAHFFNDAATAATRTISIVLTSGTSTRTYSVSGALGTAPFTSNTWVTIDAEIENPTSSTGAAFDVSAITAISVKFIDSANKSGTVYWDTVRLEGSLDLKHQIYTSDGSTVSVIVQPELYVAGDTLLLSVRNTGASKVEYMGVVSGLLDNA